MAVSNGKLYAAWWENTGVNKDQIKSCKIQRGDQSTLVFVDGNHESNGINFSNSKNANSVNLSNYNFKLYAIWAESYLIKNTCTVYNGDESSPAWTFIDGNSSQQAFLMVNAVHQNQS